LSRRFRDIARLFLADRRGAIAAMTAVLATTLVGFGGLAAETAFWYAQKRALQTQADAAALSGAYELLQGNAANAARWATNDAVLNGVQQHCAERDQQHVQRHQLSGDTDLAAQHLARQRLPADRHDQGAGHGRH
jgi:uncharacterized membrane protein